MSPLFNFQVNGTKRRQLEDALCVLACFIRDVLSVMCTEIVNVAHIRLMAFGCFNFLIFFKNALWVFFFYILKAL